MYLEFGKAAFLCHPSYCFEILPEFISYTAHNKGVGVYRADDPEPHLGKETVLLLVICGHKVLSNQIKLFNIRKKQENDNC